jgi:hypothetical protein
MLILEIKILIIVIWKMLFKRFALAKTIWSCLRGLICSYKGYNNINLLSQNLVLALFL